MAERLLIEWEISDTIPDSRVICSHLFFKVLVLEKQIL